MSSFFLENPIYLGLCGGFVTAVAAYFWSQTGNKIASYTAIGALALTIILVIISIQTVTTREAILQLLHDVAADLEANDHDAVFAYIHPNAPPAVQQAKTELPMYKFFEAKVTRVKQIIVNDTASPPSAIAEFNVYVELERQGQKLRIPRFVKIFFAKKDEQWLVRDYEHFEPTQGFKRD